MRNSLKHRVLPVLLSLVLVMGGVLYAPCACANTAAEGGNCCGAETSSCCAKKEEKKSCCENTVDAQQESASQGSCCTGNCSCEMTATVPGQDKKIAFGTNYDTCIKVLLSAASTIHFFQNGSAPKQTFPPRFHSVVQAQPYILNCAFLN